MSKFVNIKKKKKQKRKFQFHFCSFKTNSPDQSHRRFVHRNHKNVWDNQTDLLIVKTHLAIIDSNDTQPNIPFWKKSSIIKKWSSSYTVVHTFRTGNLIHLLPSSSSGDGWASHVISNIVYILEFREVTSGLPSPLNSVSTSCVSITNIIIFYPLYTHHSECLNS